MKNLVYLFILILCPNISLGQVTYYQETCQCGVTGAGFSTGLGAGSGNFDIYIEPGSTIKKAFLFATQFGEETLPATITLNSLNFIFDNTTVTNIDYIMEPASTTPLITLHAIDVTTLINPLTTNYQVTIPVQTGACVGCKIDCIYLYVIYENNTFSSNISSYISLNKDQVWVANEFELSTLNPLVINAPIGFATYLDRMGRFDFPLDGSYLQFYDGTNFNNIGLLQGGDGVNSQWDGGGVKGHFYYQNGQLYGLDDDTPDAMVNNSDGLADVQNYLLNDQLNWRLYYEDIIVTGGQAYNGFFITHATPCQQIDVTVPNDTTLCYGEQLQLNVTSTSPVIGYEWSTPDYTGSQVPGLSCSDCPDPIFTADSTMLYTVRIWNNDSCSVVRPIKLTVHPALTFDEIVIEDAVCGATSGSAPAEDLGAVHLHAEGGNENVANFVLTGQGSQTDSAFYNLEAGTYTFYYEHQNGCRSEDTTITIGEYNETVSAFSVSPDSGTNPLEVTFTNNSVNATDNEWYINGNGQGGNFANLQISPAGTYEIELIAWQYDPSCADTSWQTVIVYDSLMINLPNVFTPNNDGVNDAFGITTSLPVQVKGFILNRWGNEIIQFDQIINTGFTTIWNGSNETDGVYFYQIEVTYEGTEGVDAQQIVKEGFVELVR